jgi:hypothetical protein
MNLNLNIENCPDAELLKCSMQPSLGPRRIHLEYSPPPIPIRNFDWIAVDGGYDGAPDSGNRFVGYGATATAALAELLEILADSDSD